MPVEFRRDGSVGFTIGEQQVRKMSPIQVMTDAAYLALDAFTWGAVNYAIDHHIIISESTRLKIYKDTTANKCIVAAGLTGAAIAASYHDTFRRIGILRSEVTTSDRWQFDSYVIAQARENNKWYAVSPAVHRIPQEGEPLFTTYESETLEELLAAIHKKNPSWRWPDAPFIDTNMLFGLPEFTSDSTIKIQLISLDFPVGRRQKDNPKRYVIHMNLATGEPVLTEPEDEVLQLLRKGRDLLLHLSDSIGRRRAGQMPVNRQGLQKQQ